jgi:hypothetical protein
MHEVGFGVIVEISSSSKQSVWASGSSGNQTPFSFERRPNPTSVGTTKHLSESIDFILGSALTLRADEWNLLASFFFFMAWNGVR